MEGNEEEDEHAKVTAGEPDTRGEWRNYSVRTEVPPVPPQRPLADLQRDISEKKWVEAR